MPAPPMDDGQADIASLAATEYADDPKAWSHGVSAALSRQAEAQAKARAAAAKRNARAPVLEDPEKVRYRHIKDGLGSGLDVELGGFS